LRCRDVRVVSLSRHALCLFSLFPLFIVFFLQFRTINYFCNLFPGRAKPFLFVPCKNPPLPSYFAPRMRVLRVFFLLLFPFPSLLMNSLTRTFWDGDPLPLPSRALQPIFFPMTRIALSRQSSHHVWPSVFLFRNFPFRFTPPLDLCDVPCCWTKLPSEARGGPCDSFCSL